MSVSLQPRTTLGFPRPLTQLVKRSLTITNHNDRPVAFKVKTTAPKLYCVRPNSGRVEPGETMEVSVMLQAMKEEPPLNAKCKDKFLIQSTMITKEKEDKSLQEIWNVSDTDTDENRVHQQKLKVQYLRAEEQTLEEEDEPVMTQSSMMTVAPTTNGHSFAAPIPEFTRPPAPPVMEERSASPPADFSVAREEEHHEDIYADHPPPPHMPIAVHVQAPTETTPPAVEHRQPSLAPTPPSDELLTKYQEAEAEIERLRGLLAAAAPPVTELRKRSRRYSDADTIVPGSDVGTYIDEPPMQPDGVPLQVVVIIALGVFIMTYLFF
ncbi:PapD-like protein [Mucidula mucida]|nr:PapD-like protein [Mucidula mucida]